MPRLSRLFVRKQEPAAGDPAADTAQPAIGMASRDPQLEPPSPAADVSDRAAPLDLLDDPSWAVRDHRATVADAGPGAAPAPGLDAPHQRGYLSAGAPPGESLVAERRGGAMLIGGEEEDIVPVIPDTQVEFSASDSAFDEEAVMQAAIDALMGACTLLVGRVKRIRSLQDGSQIVAALLDLARELDARYAEDWGVVRRNGLELVLNEVRGSLPEGDQFILESLEDGQGGLTAENFLRDLRTIAAADRPRMVANYADFLIFVLHCVLRQYLSALQQDPARLRDVTARLNYLIDGIRDTVLARIKGIP